MLQFAVTVFGNGLLVIFVMLDLPVVLVDTLVVFVVGVIGADCLSCAIVIFVVVGLYWLASAVVVLFCWLSTSVAASLL